MHRNAFQSVPSVWSDTVTQRGIGISSFSPLWIKIRFRALRCTELWSQTLITLITQSDYLITLISFTGGFVFRCVGLIIIQENSDPHPCRLICLISSHLCSVIITHRAAGGWLSNKACLELFTDTTNSFFISLERSEFPLCTTPLFLFLLLKWWWATPL